MFIYDQVSLCSDPQNAPISSVDTVKEKGRGGGGEPQETANLVNFSFQKPSR